MADWAGHLAIAAGTGKLLRLRNLHVVLLGTVLPDIPAILGTLYDLTWLRVDAYWLLLAFIPLTSAFAVLCLCLAAAAWVSHPWRALPLLLVGAVLHMTLDLWQVGNVQLPAYPFSFYIINRSVYNYGDGIDSWFSVASIVALIGMRFLPLDRDIHVRWKYGWLSLAPLGILAVVIAGNTARLEQSNVLNIRFLKGEGAAENERVSVITALVVQSNPLMVQKGKCKVEVAWLEPVRVGAIVSVWGRYNGNRILADKLVQHSEFRKMTFSAIGAILLLLYWIDIPFWDRRQERQKMKNAAAST